MMNQFKLGLVIFGIITFCYGVYLLEEYRYDECRSIGHTKLYCLTN